LDSGHVLDFTDKAFEALDIAGWDNAEQVLTSLVPLYAQASRMEERSSWRHPVDVVGLLQDHCFDRLPGALEKGKSKGDGWQTGNTLIIETLMGDNPKAIVELLIGSLEDGAKPEELAACVAYAAALRIAQFPTTNEYSDWDTALHTFTFANAVQQALRRLPTSIELLRAVFDAAMSNYLNRFLNVPAVAVPAMTSGSNNNSHKNKNHMTKDIMDEFLDTLDKRQQINEAATIVAALLANEREETVFPMLVHALLREDRSFHTIQMIDAALTQYRKVKQLHIFDDDNHYSCAVLLIAAARYLAAHTPTARSQGQTFDIAWRLHQGGKLYEEIG
jgi:hypothetical protein